LRGSKIGLDGTEQAALIERFYDNFEMGAPAMRRFGSKSAPMQPVRALVRIDVTLAAGIPHSETIGEAVIKSVFVLHARRLHPARLSGPGGDAGPSGVRHPARRSSLPGVRG
jgi:hypothetical protein